MISPLGGSHLEDPGGGVLKLVEAERGPEIGHCGSGHALGAGWAGNATGLLDCLIMEKLYYQLHIGSKILMNS